MKHEIDLSRYNLYTDLTIDKIENNDNKFNMTSYKKNNIKVSKVFIDNNASKIIKKDVGEYITIEFDDVTDITNRNNITKILSKELSNIMKINKNDLILVVGLGNIESTPDSLGPKVVDNIVITNHIYELGLLNKVYKRVCAIKPGVYAKTGIETSTIIKSIVKSIKPNLVIIIDSLASTSLNRLNKTIEINNTGISPGSGIGNNRGVLNKKSLKTNVVALGVPTVVSATTIVNELTNSNISIKKNNLVVTPTEIDYLIECLYKIISNSLNDVFN